VKKLCTAPECQRPHRAKGLCVLHYEQKRLEGAAPCSVGGCNKRAEKRGLCGAHYFRWRMHGDALAGRSPNGEREAFLTSFQPPETDDCILWPFGDCGHGYGSQVGELGYPHQFVCSKFHGPAPTEHEVAHGCGNRKCINPKHLRWALHVENEADKFIHGTRKPSARRMATGGAS
jgi:hypothetical protein